MIAVEHAGCVFRHERGTVVKALDDVSLEIGNGEFLCLLGRSGHGKSTLLRSLAGLNSLTAGSIKVDGSLISGPSADRSMVFQDDTVFPWMTVEENVAFGLKMQGKSRTEQKQEARHWLSLVGLTQNVDAWPKELSGGMRKRVAIAAAFATGAPTLLMDEPFGALDYVTRMDLQKLLLRLWSETGRTIVFVTHDIEEALVLASRIVMIRRGRVAEDAQVHLPRPRDAEVRALPEGVRLTKTILQCLQEDA